MDKRTCAQCGKILKLNHRGVFCARRCVWRAWRQRSVARGYEAQNLPLATPPPSSEPLLPAMGPERLRVANQLALLARAGRCTGLPSRNSARQPAAHALVPASAVPRARLRLRRIGRLLGYGLLELMGLLLVLLASGATYESIASRQAARRYQAPGQLIDVGGHRLHLHCSGQGSPTVVLDTGLGMPSASWVLVQPGVAQWTRVCAYDRAGYGFSDPGPTPRTSQRIVEELRALLDRAGEPAPYVLAGHSFGGFTIRLFASRYPSQVAGLVLIDASHEDFATRLHEADAQTQQQRRRQTQRQIELGLVALRFGLLRLAPALAGWDMTNSTFRRLPPEAVHEMLALFLIPKAIRAAGGELDAFAESADQLRAAGKLGALPMIVLTAGGRTGDPAGQTAEEVERHRLWRHELQPELARLSSRGKQIMVANTDHVIPLEQPEAVIAALRDVIEQARKSSH